MNSPSGVHRELPWKPIALVTTAMTIVFGLLLLPACCCVRGSRVAIGPAPAQTIPLIGTEPIPTPTEAQAKAPVQTEMHGVWFHLDPEAFLDIHALRGEIVSKDAGAPVNFDNKRSFVIRVDTGTIGMNSRSLDILMNRYVFGYPNAPLRDLHVEPAGRQLKQSGIIHKVVDIPFTMWADVSASRGMIRIHPTKIDICGINGIGLLKAVHQNLEKMLALPHDRGVTAEGNDLLLDPAKVLPPPEVILKLVEVRIEGDELIQVFDAGLKLPPLQPHHPEERHWMYYRGGTLRMGKLLMVDADMQVADTDPSDPFDFFIDRYNDQLVAGYSRNQPSYGLLVFMRDFRHLTEPPRPGERLAPK